MDINSLMFFLFIFIVILFWLVMTVSDRGGIGLTLHTVFFVYFICVPGYIQYIRDAWPWQQSRIPSNNDVFIVLCELILYAVSFSFGYFLKSRSNEVGDPIKIVKANTGTIIFGAFTILPVVALIYFVGFTTFFTTRGLVGDIVYSSQHNLPMLYAFSKFTVFASFLFYLIVLCNKQQMLHSRFIFLLILVLLIAGNIIVNNPFSSPRFHFLSMLIAICIVLGGWKSKQSSIYLFLFSPLFLYVLFPYTKLFGTFFYYGGWDFNLNLLDYISTSPDYDAFQQIVNTFWYVEHVGFSFGLNFIAGVAFFVPRAIWLSKPINLGILSATANDYVFTNLSAPIVSELYYALGWFAIVFGGILFGYFFNAFDHTIKLGIERYGVLRYGISVIMVSFSFIIFRGSFGAVFPLISVLLFIFSLHSYVRCCRW